MAPPKWRGALSTAFQLFLTVGVIIANVITLQLASDTTMEAPRFSDRTWMASLGAGGVLALIMSISAFFIPDTPGSLIQRGKVNQARQSLLRIRGTESESELNQLNLIITHNKAMTQDPYKLIMQRRYRPHLVLTIALSSCQQLTGFNVIAFYEALLFRSVGFDDSTAPHVSLILGVVSIMSTFVSSFVIDSVGRRLLLLQAGVQILICQVLHKYDTFFFKIIMHQNGWIFLLKMVFCFG